MTLSPSEYLKCVPVMDRGDYKTNEICAKPGCMLPAHDKHHLWRRSMTGTPCSWVNIDGVIAGNIVGLCRQHHQDVNGGIGGHRAWITLEDGVFVWNEKYPNDDEWFKKGPLQWQPPIDGVKNVTSVTEHVHGDNETCPLCGHRKTPKKREAGKPKTRLTVMYPKDEEIVLPEMLEQVRLACDRPIDTSPYYVIMDALVFLLQHEHLLRNE